MLTLHFKSWDGKERTVDVGESTLGESSTYPPKNMVNAIEKEGPIPRRNVKEVWVIEMDEEDVELNFNIFPNMDVELNFNIFPNIDTLRFEREYSLSRIFCLSENPLRVINFPPDTDSCIFYLDTNIDGLENIMKQNPYIRVNLIDR